MTDVLTNLIVIIVLQYIHISNHYTVHLKLTQYYVNYISVKLGRKTRTFKSNCIHKENLETDHIHLGKGTASGKT